MSGQVYTYNKPFSFEAGGTLPSLQIHYHTYGNYIPGKSKVVWVCHALTANSDVYDWWPGLFGEEHFFNSKDYFIVCANNLGSCYGTSGPLTKPDTSSKSYFHHFPEFTIRDIVSVHKILREHLQIEKIHVLIGGSQGGQQLLEWAIEEPNAFENIIPIATNAFHSPWGIAFNESQRLSIYADPTFIEEKDDAGINGMKAARSIALLSYRNYFTYKSTQTEDSNQKHKDFKAASYQKYQGDKLAKRFNAFSYVGLSKAMDSHNLGRGRESVENALSKIKAKTLVIGVSSDLLFPPEEQKYLAEHIPNAHYQEIDSLYGHDGFLIEAEQLTNKISNFLKNNKQ